MSIMSEITFNGLKAHYRTWGEGRPVLLLHSGGSSGAQWERFAEAAPPRWRLIAPDLIGFGRTERWLQAGRLTHDLQAQLAADTIDVNTDMPVDVVGHSYGGATALRLAIDYPSKVRSLVLIEPVTSCVLGEVGDPLFAESRIIAKTFIASAESGRPEIGWQSFIDSRSGVGTWARLSDTRRQQFLAQSEQTRDAFLSNLNNRTTLAECSSLVVPVTLIIGAETTPCDRRTAEVLRDVLRTVVYVAIAGAGHMSPLTHPKAVVAIVRDHLQRLESDS
ncbi:MAG: alpha/beta fold hydrolase [Geminicoccaceae bacterium]